MSDIAIYIILGIIEGLTEFLPVSSTGHLILAGELLGFTGEGSVAFKVAIQLGAILAVLVAYWGRFWGIGTGLLRGEREAIWFTRNILIGFLPAMLIGAVAYEGIRQLIQSPMTVAVALIVGGIAILVIERMVKMVKVERVETMPLPTAVAIGLVQCIAMIPGVSRSGATIMGALLMGVERKTAAEFSFFLAVPTMLGATTLQLLKNQDDLGQAGAWGIALGFVVSFVVAVVVIRWFIGIVSKHGFAPFGWYRIAAGAAALAWLALR